MYLQSVVVLVSVFDEDIGLCSQLPNSAIKQCTLSVDCKEIQRNRNFFAGPQVDGSLPEVRA